METTTSASGDQEEVSRAGDISIRVPGTCQAKENKHVPHRTDAFECMARLGIGLCAGRTKCVGVSVENQVVPDFAGCPWIPSGL